MAETRELTDDEVVRADALAQAVFDSYLAWCAERGFATENLMQTKAIAVDMGGYLVMCPVKVTS